MRTREHFTTAPVARTAGGPAARSVPDAAPQCAAPAPVCGTGACTWSNGITGDVCYCRGYEQYYSDGGCRCGHQAGYHE